MVRKPNYINLININNEIKWVKNTYGFWECENNSYKFCLQCGRKLGKNYKFVICSFCRKSNLESLKKQNSSKKVFYASKDEKFKNRIKIGMAFLGRGCRITDEERSLIHFKYARDGRKAFKTEVINWLLRANALNNHLRLDRIENILKHCFFM